MIIRFRDGGTRAFLDEDYVNGLDRVTYTQPSFWEENYISEPKAHLQEADLVKIDGIDVRKWPVKLPGKMWIDQCVNYEGSSDDGLRFRIKNDDVSVDFPEFTEDIIQIDTDADPEKRIEEQWVTSFMNHRDVTTISDGEFLRLDTWNESQGTLLKEEFTIITDGLPGSHWYLELLDNSMFVPFDFSMDFAYRVEKLDGTPVPDDIASILLKMQFDCNYNVYLRPRKCRWLAQTYARYMHVTAFELVYNDEYHLRSFYARLPVYPGRHNIIHTAGNEDVWHEMFGWWMAYDNGINDWWETSMAYALLTQDIVDSQWWTLCSAYILVYVWPTSITIRRETPARGSIVAIIELDDGVDTTSYVVRQIVDLSEKYPRTQIGTFYGEPVYW